MPTIPAPGRRQEQQEFRAILSYSEPEASLGYVKLGFKNTIKTEYQNYNPNKLHGKLPIEKITQTEK